MSCRVDAVMFQQNPAGHSKIHYSLTSLRLYQPNCPWSVHSFHRHLRFKVLRSLDGSHEACKISNLLTPVVFDILKLHSRTTLFCLSFQSSQLNEDALAPRPKVRLETFQWQPRYEKANATKITTCRNSVQGKHLITDDHGEDKALGLCSKNNQHTLHNTQSLNYK